MQSSSWLIAAYDLRGCQIQTSHVGFCPGFAASDNCLPGCILCNFATASNEITFIAGGYFANMYNTREQVSRNLHDGLQMVSDVVGGGYRPKSVVEGFLSVEDLRYLAEEQDIDMV